MYPYSSAFTLNALTAWLLLLASPLWSRRYPSKSANFMSTSFESNPTTSFNAGLESLRACAIVAVVQLHCMRPYFEATQHHNAGEDALRCVLDFATPSFFFIAGYLSNPRSTVRRLSRAITPLIVASCVKYLLSLSFAYCRRLFWQSLIHDLSLHHLGPKPFAPNCVLHDKLRALETYYGYDKPLPSLHHLVFQATTGSAFGHYYFVPVLCQMHLIARLLLARISDANVVKLALFLSLVWHPVRTLPFTALGVPDAAAFRLPLLWGAYYINGIAAKHCAATKLRALALFSIAIVSMLIAIGLSLTGVWIRSLLFFKDVYTITLAPAVCLLFKPTASTSCSSGGNRLCVALAFVRGELARLSYFIYLYHGFFLDHHELLPQQLIPVLTVTLALAYLLQYTLRPTILATAFGIPATKHTIKADTSVGGSSRCAA